MPMLVHDLIRILRERRFDDVKLKIAVPDKSKFELGLFELTRDEWNGLLAEQFDAPPPTMPRDNPGV